MVEPVALWLYRRPKYCLMIRFLLIFKAAKIAQRIARAGLDVHPGDAAG
ncbi:MAG: hypothetical protein R3C68_05895 [Myxococcota bacterium]